MADQTKNNLKIFIALPQIESIANLNDFLNFLNHFWSNQGEVFFITTNQPKKTPGINIFNPAKAFEYACELDKKTICLFLGHQFPLGKIILESDFSYNQPVWISGAPSSKLSQGWKWHRKAVKTSLTDSKSADLYPICSSFMTSAQEVKITQIHQWMNRLDERLAPSSTDKLHLVLGPLFSYEKFIKNKSTFTSFANSNERPFLFLDRDGVIIEDVSYPHKINDMMIFKEIIPIIKHAQKKGFGIGIVSNQAGIAKNKFDLIDYENFTQELLDRFKKEQISFDFVSFCPFHPEGSNLNYRLFSHNRKPHPGMILIASQNHPIDLERSIMVGDRPSDLINSLRHQTLFLKGKYEYPSDFKGLVLKDHIELKEWILTNIK